MDHDRFISFVSGAAQIDREQAQRATQATLQTLAERIDRGEARDLAEQLPPELAPWIATTTPAERFDVDEFLRRVGEREGVDLPTAERHVRIVFDALRRAIATGELADVAAELSKDYAALLPRGPWVDVLPADAFVEKVAERAGLDREAAAKAVDATLETLAERIAGGEVDDLIARLAVGLHAPLERGNASSHGAARRMGFDEFVRLVAEREGVSPAEAREHARAVFATLREAVGDDEFFDVTVQLPDEYVPLLAR